MNDNLRIKSEDFPKVKKTKIMLMNGFMQMLKDESIDKIMIKDLAELSEVGRKTFYRHYSTKEDVIREYLQLRMKEFLGILKIKNIHSTYEKSIEYFRWWKSHKTLIEIIDKNSLFLLLLEEYNNAVIFYRESNSSYDFLLPLGEKSRLNQYYNAFNLAGLWNVLIYWMRNGTKESIEEMAELTTSMISEE